MITAGEWYVEDGRLTHPQTGAKSGGTGLRVQARFQGPDSSFNVATINGYAGGNEDDARLIAAAKDLLAALKGVVAVADRRTTEFDAAHAAIAKAEGRS